MNYPAHQPQPATLLADSFCPSGFTCGQSSASLVPATGAPGSTWIITVNHWVDSVMIWVLGVSLVVAIVYIIVGVFIKATTVGGVENQQQAHARIAGAVIGLVLVIIAYILLKLALFFLTRYA